MKNKCLVSEVMDKCQCESCKMSRRMRDFSVRCIVQAELREELYDILEKEKEKDEN